MFKGFKPQALQKIANSMGYQGPMQDFDTYLEQNPDKQREMVVYEEAAKEMARGGVVKMQQGGQAQPRPLTQQYIPQQNIPAGASIGDVSAQKDVTFSSASETKLVPVQYGVRQFTPWTD